MRRWARTRRSTIRHQRQKEMTILEDVQPHELPVLGDAIVKEIPAGTSPVKQWVPAISVSGASIGYQAFVLR